MTGKGILLGGMEGGGTKCSCVVGTGPEDISEEIRFPTTTPDETLDKAIGFFKKHEVSSIGLAPFGPLDLDPFSPTYGSITATPKPGWSQIDITGRFHQAFKIPLAFDTDVNAAAFGEYFWNPENHDFNSLIYFTIGTGIGAGIIANGRILHGLTHPETGHMRIPHDKFKDPFLGSCPFHGDCFEGLASGTSLKVRWGQSGDTLPDDHRAWEWETGYIACALVNIILTISPQRIVLGGGVMERRFLFERIRAKVRTLLNGYIPSPVIAGNMDRYIVPPSLGNRAGVLGAMAMAKLLLEGN